MTTYLVVVTRVKQRVEYIIRRIPLSIRWSPKSSRNAVPGSLWWDVVLGAGVSAARQPIVREDLRLQKAPALVANGPG